MKITKILSVLLALVFVLSAIACTGAGNTDETSAETTTHNEETTAGETTAEETTAEITEAPTETEAPTGPVTEAPTETEAPTSVETTVESVTVPCSESVESSGCGSVLGLSAAVVALAAALMLCRRKDEN